MRRLGRGQAARRDARRPARSAAAASCARRASRWRRCATRRPSPSSPPAGARRRADCSRSARSPRASASAASGLLSAELGAKRFHRADLLRVGADGEPPEAIEVELTAKGQARLDELLRAWRWAVAEQRLRRVVYRCPPRIRPSSSGRSSAPAPTRAVAVEGL